MESRNAVQIAALQHARHYRETLKPVEYIHKSTSGTHPREDRNTGQNTAHRAQVL